MLSRYDHVGVWSDTDFCRVEPSAHKAVCSWKSLRGGARVGNYHIKARYFSEASQRLSETAMTGDDQFGRWQDRININLHYSSTGHSDSKNFIAQIQRYDSWSALLDTFDGLLPDRIFDAAAADPTRDQFGIGVDQR